MRLRALVAGVAVVAIVGCGRPSQYNVALQVMTAELSLHFANLNNDAELRKMDLKTPRLNVDDPPSMGRIYSDFVWTSDENMVVVLNVECARCKTLQDVPGYRCGVNSRVICPTCAAGDDKGEKGKKSPPLLEGGLDYPALVKKCGAENVKRMFQQPESEPGPKDPIKAKIVYLRRLWVFDTYGKIDPPNAKAVEKYGVADITKITTDVEPYMADSIVDVSGEPVGPKPNPQEKGMPVMMNYHAGGFHRLDATFIVEFEATYDGTLKMGELKEHGLRPWNNPRSLLGPQRYQTRGEAKK